MSDRSVILKLARVIVAVAWTDGEVTNEEVNSLKDLLLHLPRASFDTGLRVSSEEWARLEMYLETPVGDEERGRLIADLQDEIRTTEDKELVLRALENMVKADGTVTDDEKQALVDIGQALNSSNGSLLGGFQRLLGGGAVSRRSEAVANAPNREQFYDDFIKNRVYYNVIQRLQIDETELNLSDLELRRLSLAGGLMAKVAQIDRQVSDEEYQSIIQAFQKYWHLDLKGATFVAEVAVSAIDVTFDTFRMMRELTACTTEEERQRFLVALFSLASADGKISNEEHEEIRLVSHGLNLTHKDFINAKLEVIDG